MFTRGRWKVGARLQAERVKDKTIAAVTLPTKPLPGPLSSLPRDGGDVRGGLRRMILKAILSINHLTPKLKL
jgi:hypothetical protein